MSKLNLILLRHGETDHNSGLRLTGWGDPELNERGKAQARSAALRLTAEHKIEQIYVSPLIRARQTAEPLAELTGLTPLVKADLKELNFGEMEGMSIPEIKERMPELFTAWRSNDPDFGWPGGETRQTFHTRVDRALWEIIINSAGIHNTVAVVGHGAALAGFVTEIMTGSPYLWREWLLENCEHYIIQVDYQHGLPLQRDKVTFRLDYIGKKLELVEENRLRAEAGEPKKHESAA
jgi:broad specificity phosphatase PhoE